MEDNSCPESHALIVQEVRRESSWTWQDYILLVMGLLISFGDGIELYLPGKTCSHFRFRLICEVLPNINKSTECS